MALDLNTDLVRQLRYQSVAFPGKEITEATVGRNDAAELLFVPLAASLHSDDRVWAQGVCARLAGHADSNVRGNALLGFAHLARRFRELDRQIVEPIMRGALSDRDPYVSAQARTALDDVEQYLGWSSSPEV